MMLGDGCRTQLAELMDTLELGTLRLVVPGGFVSHSTSLTQILPVQSRCCCVPMRPGSPQSPLP